MSTPVGHSLVGVSICFLVLRKFSDWKTLLFCAIAACLPDIDFLPGIFAGNMNYYHHRGTHSIFFAFIVSLAVWALAKKKNGFKLGSIAFILVLSHLAIDYIAIDRAAPFGIPLLWPFSGKYFYFRYAFLPEVLRGDSVISIFNWHNLRTMIVELFIFLPIALLLYKRVLKKGCS